MNVIRLMALLCILRESIQPLDDWCIPCVERLRSCTFGRRALSLRNNLDWLLDNIGGSDVLGFVVAMTETEELVISIIWYSLGGDLDRLCL